MTSIASRSKRKRSDHRELKRAFVSCLLGSAIGDALGMPFERVPAARIKASFPLPITGYCDPIEGAPCLEFNLKRGMYTDDTQSSRATVRGILEAGGLSENTIAEALAAWLFDGSLGQAPRYPGITTRKAMQNYRKRNDPKHCGIDSPTCGAAIRIAPAALWLSLRTNEDFDQGIKKVSCITHTGTTAVDGALIVAHCIRAAISNSTPDLQQLLSLCKSKFMIRSLRKTQYALSQSMTGTDLVEDIGNETGSHQVVPLALYHLYKNEFHFEEALKDGLATMHPCGLDLDCVLSIAGAIAGARWPEEVELCPWAKDVEDGTLIAAEANRLYRLAAKQQS